MLVRDNKYIPEKDRDFFILLRTGLWQRVEEELSPEPDWPYILRLSCEQTVQGIVADGIALYRSVHPDCAPPSDVLDNFFSQTAQIIRQNYKVNLVQAKLSLLLKEKQIFHVVLKGQGAAQNYPKPLLRCSGDIDFFFAEKDYQDAKLLLRPLASSTEEKPYSLECSYLIDGVFVELHGAMASGINHSADSHLLAILNDMMSEKGQTRIFNIQGGAITLPSPRFDAIYILTHALRHLGSFGISLRQIIDWTMYLHANSDKIDQDVLKQDIQAMHIRKLWDIMGQFAEQWLGLDSNCIEAAKDDYSKSGLQLWKMVRASGSFGHKSPYFSHLHAGRLNERFARIYYHLKQALLIRKFDAEFSNYLIGKELQDVLAAPFRFISGRKTKITG